MPHEKVKKVLKTDSALKTSADTAYELQYTKWALKSLGIWSMVSDNTTHSERISSLLIIMFNLFAIAFILIPCSMHMLFREKNPRRRLLLIGPITFRISNILKYFSMMFRVELIKQCLNHVKGDWSDVDSKAEEEILLKSVKIGRNLTRLCAIFMFSAGLFYHTVMPLLKKKRVNAFNVTIRPHAYPGYDFFVDSQASPVYEMIFGMHCIFAVAGYFITIAACNLASTFVSHICGQVEIMNWRLQGVNGCSEETFKVAERIASIIECHVKILRLSKMIEQILREICMVEVVASTLIICLLEYYCMTEWGNSETASLITYFMLLTSLTFNIFIFCYIGEILKHQCEVVGELTYLARWYQISSKNTLKLALIIGMARVPRKITAGGMMDLTIQSFGSVIKTSVAYLNMLRAMADS
nr:odorant receptor 51 [Psyttalia incisi]